jgi:hypothetical protein
MSDFIAKLSGRFVDFTLEMRINASIQTLPQESTDYESLKPPAESLSSEASRAVDSIW